MIRRHALFSAPTLGGAWPARENRIVVLEFHD